MSVTTIHYVPIPAETEEHTKMEYGDEVLCAEWNSAVSLVPYTSGISQSGMPGDLTDANVELFMQQMHRFQI